MPEAYKIVKLRSRWMFYTLSGKLIKQGTYGEAVANVDYYRRTERAVLESPCATIVVQ